MLVDHINVFWIPMSTISGSFQTQLFESKSDKKFDFEKKPGLSKRSVGSKLFSKSAKLLCVCSFSKIYLEILSRIGSTVGL